MALVAPPSDVKKRVKVYELKNNDWFDRGTGFCTGRIINEESKIYVEAEDEPQRLLLETRISKDDGYQKQQDTLIVWTESSGVDMALSFQEAEGCAAIWEFVNSVQQSLLALGGPDDALSDADMDSFAQPLVLPQPEIGNLEEIEHHMRSAASANTGRDALAKFVISEDYIRKLIPLVETAEDLESLKDLHLLCNIMKLLVLLNDSQIIDQIVSEPLVFGVIGALEYDPDFPNHKANHRRYLKDNSRYKEVLSIADPAITKKIHATWRLTYLKDVVLARILDDPTFGVLNSLIFFNQVDIISHLQSNAGYLDELFGIIDNPEADIKKKKDAVGFIQSCCAIAKSLQAPARATLYTNFINHGLLRVITFAILNKEASIRVAGTDILVAMIDHDPSMVRAYIFKSISEKKTPLTDTLVELLLVEVDLGVKAQAADAIKVLLEPQQPPPAQIQEGMTRQNGEFMSKLRPNPQTNPQTESFINHFYGHSADKLFQPLMDLEKRQTLNDITFHDVQLYNHLVEILMYLCRTHQFTSKFYIHNQDLASRIAQLLSAPQKHLKLTALKFFRQCVGLQDEFYNRQITQKKYFTPILNIVYETMPRDNLLNSACLELFEFIKRENLKPLIIHLVETCRPRLQEITYVDTFQTLILRYDQMQGFTSDGDTTLFSNDGTATPNRTPNVNGNRWQGVKDMDAAEEAYFNTSDDEDETSPKILKKQRRDSIITNGVATSPMLKSLVDYPDDDEDAMDTRPPEPGETSTEPKLSPSPMLQTPPPERLSEKRRREENDDEDELGKLTSTKRRSSGSSIGSTTSTNTLKRKKGFVSKNEIRDAPAEKGGIKKIEISISAKTAESDHGSKPDDGGFALAPTQSIYKPALDVSSYFAERAEEDQGSGNSFEMGVYGDNSRISTRDQATAPSIFNTGSNRFYTWNIPNTLYDIYIITVPPYLPTLPIVPLSEVYILAITECHVKIAQGLGGHSSENLTFTAQDVQLDWEVSVPGAGLNYSMLLRVFATLVELNVRPASPLPDLIAKDLSFTVAHRIERRYTGSGVVSVTEAGNEVLAKRSLNPSLAPQLLQPLASQQPNTTSSLSFNTTDPETVFEYLIPSTPYVLVIHTYSLWSLLQLEALEEVYNRAHLEIQENIDQGRGGSRPPMFSVFYSPVRVVWRADVVGEGLNYSMLSIVFTALEQLHTDPAPRLHTIFRKMIYYDIYEQRGAQRFEIGGGQVQSTQTISKRQSVNPLHKDYAYEIPSTPYNLLVTAYSDHLMPITPLQEVYSNVISALGDKIAQGRGAAKSVDFVFREPPVTLLWTRADERSGLNYTDLLKAFMALKLVHLNPETPWHARMIWYSVVIPNSGQEFVSMGGGRVEDLLPVGPSNVSVQTSKRNLATPANPLPSYACQLPNTPYVLDIRAVPPIFEPQLPLDPLIAIYDLAYHDFEDEINTGHGGDVPLKFNIVLLPFALNWQREDPPGLNYSMLLRVYHLLETLQVDEATPFPQGYRQSLLFRVLTINEEIVGLGKVIG